MRTVSQSFHTATPYRAQADALTSQLRELRKLVPRSGNNSPKPCSDPYAYNLHNGLGTKVLPFHHLFALFLCYKRDGVPGSLLLSIANQFVREVEVLVIDEHQRQSAFPGPQMVRLESAKETKLEGRFNPVQHQVAVDPTDADALSTVIREGTLYVAQCNRYLDACRTQLAVVRGDQAKRVYGDKPLTRATTIEVMR